MFVLLCKELDIQARLVRQKLYSNSRKFFVAGMVI